MYYHDETTADALEAWSDSRREADLGQSVLEARANRLYAHEQAGFCTHQSAVGYRPTPFYDAQKGLKPGQYRCTDGCGTTFDDELAWVDASQDPYRSPVRIRRAGIPTWKSTSPAASPHMDPEETL